MNRRRKRETQGRNTGNKTHTQQRDKGPAWVQLCINPNPEVERGWRRIHEQKAVSPAQECGTRVRGAAVSRPSQYEDASRA